MDAQAETAYREYVVTRIDGLRRTAYLMCQNWHTADDLVSTTLTNLYRKWRRAQEASNLDAYVRRILLNTWIDEQRRPWRRETLRDNLPAGAVHAAADRCVHRRSGAVLEHEHRTLLLAWSQDVSPTRWLWTKVGLLGLFVATVTTAVGGVSDYLERMQARVAPVSLFDYLPFLNTGMLPVAISLCWFAVGVALGAALKRTLPAMFSVIAGFIGLTFLVQWRYPTLMEPLSAHLPLGRSDGGLPRGHTLIVEGGIVDNGVDGPSGAYDASGRQLSGVELQRLCPPQTDWATTLSCYSDNQLQQHVLYQPGSRITDFHLIVAAGYLGLTVAALAAAWWLVRRTNLNAG